MALKSYKPYTPGLRQKTVLLNEELTAKKPEKSLTTKLKKTPEQSRRLSTIRTEALISHLYSMQTVRSATLSLLRG